MLTQEAKNIKMGPDQILGGFLMMLGGQIAVTIPHVPPHVVAEQLMNTAAKLLAGIDQQHARESLAVKLAENFKLQVETNAIAMHTTKGGIIVPPKGARVS